jgi:hydrogenase maturation protein HypF
MGDTSRAETVTSGQSVPQTAAAVRTRITATGVVQGVGFRPFAHRLATELGVTGFVGNDAAAVFIEAQGSSRTVSEFTLRLSAEPPPLALITDVNAEPASAVTTWPAGRTVRRRSPGSESARRAATSPSR